MAESIVMHIWSALMETLATLAIVSIAFGLMVGAVKAADAVKQVGAIVGIVIVLLLAPCVLLAAWSNLSAWQRITLIAIPVGVWLWRRSGTSRVSKS